MSPAKNFEIAIVGGGIAGVTLAIALQHRGISTTIYEQAHTFGEIGAGVSFTPNAIQAMKICHGGVYEAFDKVCTRNLWPSKQKVWFDFFDGYGGDIHEVAFSILTSEGQNGVHRAQFLKEMVKLIPQDTAKFRKHLDTITENDDGRLLLRFHDGTSAEADAVIGADGIKSTVRRIIVGEDHPSTHPAYTYKYAYRGLVAMEDAVEAIGEQRAQNACLHMGPDGHVLTFPIDHGATLNVVAFRTSSEAWADDHKLTKPAEQKDLLRDFDGYEPNLMKLLKLTKPNLDIWAIFDTGDHPVPVFYKDRICITGDAAHATSPNHGAGAGMCIEDSAVLAELLADERVKTPDDLKAVFATFDAERRQRGHWLVQSSRRVGDCYEWRAAGVGKDFNKIEAEVNERNGIIHNVDVKKLCEKARQELGKRLETKT